MSETKFTPGPWKAVTHHRLSDGRPTCYVKASANNVGIAVQPAFSDDTNAEANATLISAAPDLYAALEKLHRHCTVSAGFDVSKVSDTEEFTAFIDRMEANEAIVLEEARAALSKARGES